MIKTVSASDAKNSFGGLLDDVASLGRVDIVKHGRRVAVMLSPATLAALLQKGEGSAASAWGDTHMIPPELAGKARMIRPPADFDED